MNTALRPFTQYITNLANGQLDYYFDTTLGPLKSPILLLHSLGNYPKDARLAGLFKLDTVFVCF